MFFIELQKDFFLLTVFLRGVHIDVCLCERECKISSIKTQQKSFTLLLEHLLEVYLDVPQLLLGKSSMLTRPSTMKCICWFCVSWQICSTQCI